MSPGFPACSAPPPCCSSGSRSAAETHAVGSLRREGSPYRIVLGTPTMLWIILSGALRNFNMYAIGSFLVPFVMRYHGADIRTAGLTATVVLGLSGIPGLLLGGMLGDAVTKRRPYGRLGLGAWAMALSVPLVFLALVEPKGSLIQFTGLLAGGWALIYCYYSSVYPSIQDVIEPSLRGTAMALYFFAMYVIGASLGPLTTGFASDYFTTHAATAAGVVVQSQRALEPYRAAGLHSAMQIIPVIGLLLAAVLFAASRTVARDTQNLQEWMAKQAPNDGQPRTV